MYTRGLLFTWMVAGAYALFGDGLAVARLPSLLCMAALVGLLFAWLRHEAGRLAAWIGAGLFAVSPFAVDTAQFARFYAPQCLALFVGAALVHAAVLGRRGRPRDGWRPRLLLAALALPPLLLAVYFQPTTLIGMAGIGVWAAGGPGPALARRRGGAGPAQARRSASARSALGLLAVLIAWQTGIVEDFWRRYRWTPLFNQDTQDQFWFYHLWLSLLYPTLWPLTGMLGLVAVVARPRVGAFALTVFALAFILNSVAAAKSLRYLVYAQPFLFAVWGVALAALWPPLRGFLQSLRRGLGDGLAELGRPYRPLSWLLLAGGLLFLLAAQPGLAAHDRPPRRRHRAARAADGRLAAREARTRALAASAPTSSSPPRSWRASISSAASTSASAAPSSTSSTTAEQKRVRHRLPHRPAGDLDHGIAGADLRLLSLGRDPGPPDELAEPEADRRRIRAG